MPSAHSRSVLSGHPVPSKPALRGFRDMAIALSLALVAGSFRWKGLDPSDLWLDDTWQALVWRADTFREVSLAGLTSKGFAFLLKGWFSAFGFSVLKAQALPLIFGVAAPAF